ncbi:hypothetical protein ACFTUC_39025 [Streptomyces sp. NPDC056944]|uniref:hypothetical protein n=1 Tax=unclassified Streptomyces TaxID=2593676 RepID=UPI00363F1162
MNALRTAKLTDNQKLLLYTLGDHWSETGNWPLWGYVQYQFDTRRTDAEAVLRSLPRIGADTPFAAGYGYTTAVTDHRPIDENATIRLTLAACWALPHMHGWAGTPFIRVLKHMIDLWDTRGATPTDPGKAYLNSKHLNALDLRPAFITALPDLLSYEPAITTGNGTTSADHWKREITRSVAQYRDVDSIDDYLDITCRIVEDNVSQYAHLTAEPFPVALTPYRLTGTAPATETPAAPNPAPYLSDRLLAELEASKHPRYRTDRLLELCHELNTNFEAQNPYACTMLIRAITDHISPAFGQKDFKQAAGQYNFGHTVRGYASKLASTKGIGDDSLHRQINTPLSTITMHDVHPPIYLSSVLAELVERLKNPDPS